MIRPAANTKTRDRQHCKRHSEASRPVQFLSRSVCLQARGRKGLAVGLEKFMQIFRRGLKAKAVVEIEKPECTCCDNANASEHERRRRLGNRTDRYCRARAFSANIG